MGFSSDLSRQRPALIPCSSRNGGGFLGARLGLSAHSGVTAPHARPRYTASLQEAVSRHGPASYCPEGYTPHSPWWGAEACRARKAPSYFDGNARASSAPGDTPFASGFMGKAQGKGVFPKTEGCFLGWDGIWSHCCEIRADHMVFPLKGREAGYASYCMFLWLIRDISQ